MTKPYSQEDLEKFALIAVSYISEKLLEDFATEPKVDFSVYERFMLDDVCVRVKQIIMGQGPFKCPAAQYPRNWIEAIKDRFLPSWLRERWPIKYTKMYFNARILYPKIKYPDEEHVITAELKEED